MLVAIGCRHKNAVLKKPRKIEKNGAHYTYRDTRLGMGREKAKEFLRTNADVAGDIEAEVRDLLLAAPSSDEEAKSDTTENTVTE